MSSALILSLREVGVVHGLTRVRGLTQDDSHSYCTPEQAPEEVEHLLSFVLGLLQNDFGIDDFARLSTRDSSKPGKFITAPMRSGLRPPKCLKTSRLPQVWSSWRPGGAAFYGPKISVQAKDAIGRTWQMSTIQYDFNQPKGFDLDYQAADGSRQQPVMIHSAKFGSGRFFGLLVEHYAGAFPPWLAPVQVQAIPVAERHSDYLFDFAKLMKAKGLRVEVDDSDERMQKKIRNAQMQKMPFMVIAGDQDIEQMRLLPLSRRAPRQQRAHRQTIARVSPTVASREQV
ncbi:MAG: threonine--tRNA ligase [Marmoricola sp.]